MNTAYNTAVIVKLPVTEQICLTTLDNKDFLLLLYYIVPLCTSGYPHVYIWIVSFAMHLLKQYV